ncbi:hypothetical protein PR003_g4945 [Phytophthora rubi]|uniref:Uncharacterized protein n=1 Tax=Phytophthora rubi TaxID=129364 RepID=A0A6A4G448_9STRA|nr:hypothetical protein PR003_g4945 [Phytophthora rubi]
MAVRRINDGIRRLDWDEVKTALLRDDDATPVEVCEASLDDWGRYVRSERQALKSRFMEWRDDRIWIVELPSSIHEKAVSRFDALMGAGTGNGLGTDLIRDLAAYAEDPPAGLAGDPFLRKFLRLEPQIATAMGGGLQLRAKRHRCWRCSTKRSELG